jgi:hypothetical protein
MGSLKCIADDDFRLAGAESAHRRRHVFVKGEMDPKAQPPGAGAPERFAIPAIVRPLRAGDSMNRNRTNQAAADEKLIDGFTKHLAPSATIVVKGKPVAQADIVKTLQGRVDAGKATDSAAAAFHNAVASEKALRQSTKPFVADVRLAVLVQFGADPNVLADFGVAPRKTPTRKVEAKATAAQKAKATRQLLGTKGKKQKKQALTTQPAPAPKPTA